MRRTRACVCVFLELHSAEMERVTSFVMYSLDLYYSSQRVTVFESRLKDHLFMLSKVSESCENKMDTQQAKCCSFSLKTGLIISVSHLKGICFIIAFCRSAKKRGKSHLGYAVLYLLHTCMGV